MLSSMYQFDAEAKKCNSTVIFSDAKLILKLIRNKNHIRHDQLF